MRLKTVRTERTKRYGEKPGNRPGTERELIHRERAGTQAKKTGLGLLPPVLVR